MVRVRMLCPSAKPGKAPGIVHISIFPPFWTGAAARRAASLLFWRFFMQDGIAFIHLRDLWVYCVWVVVCGGGSSGHMCGGREKGARSLWMLRVRSLPCAIILANALTERVWSAAPGLREKRSWAASLFTLARARRSLPSSDLNGHCLSRGAVSLATRGQKRACRAKHPAAKQGGTADSTVLG